MHPWPSESWKPIGESFRIKIVQTLKPVPYSTRVHALAEAKHNVLRLARDHVYLDFSTTRGNAGLTDRQLSALMIGDGAYAGSENFYALANRVHAVFGKSLTIPVHQGRGAEHLLLRALLRPGQQVVTNGNLLTLKALTERLQIECHSLLDKAAGDPSSSVPDKGNIPLDRLEATLRSHTVGLLVLGASLPQLGGQPLSLPNLREAAALAHRYDVPVALDASLLSSMAYLDKHARGDTQSLSSLIRAYAEPCDLVYLTGREDAGCHTGGLIATNHKPFYQRVRDLVVVYEGLHTYGGQAGRDMQVLAEGLGLYGDEEYLAFRSRQLRYIAEQLERLGYRLYQPLGLWGVSIDCHRLPSSLETSFRSHSAERIPRAVNLAALVYATSGCRLRPFSPPPGFDSLDLLTMAMPRRTYTERHVDYLIAALEQVQRYQIAHPLSHASDDSCPPELARYTCKGAFLTDYHGELAPPCSPEPYFMKVVEPCRLPTAEERARAIREAGYNTFLLRSRDIYIDLLTDSGTAAMSNAQWAQMLETQESELGSPAFAAFVERCHEILGYRYILPTHQGRAAEHILSQSLIRPGQYVINNMYFTTTREHQERAGGIFVDLIVDEAYDPQSTYPFKGDLDAAELQRFIDEHGADAIAYVCLETNVNMAGGQPLSLSNTREVSAICRYHHIPLMFDATRLAENAFLIQQREPGYAEWSIKDIVHELLSLGDGCTISAKKDVLVNIGGILAVNDRALYERCAALCTTFEGTPWSGGLASRDLAAMAVGLEEMTDQAYIRSRVEQVHYLWSALRAHDIPVVEPAGGHAVFLDARRFLPHIPQARFPAQRVAAAIYEVSGVRGMERGQVSAGRDPRTGHHRPAKLELVRLTIPRRVYTSSHMDVVAAGVRDVFSRRNALTGLRFVYEPPTLRFFNARFELAD
ncbi:MAG: tryptophanase [Nitrospirae bacterium]|nr:MAG: tryptophanase [Nitrospirota bacterium]